MGTLLTTGGAGEIVDPIIKMADPGPELTSLVNFLKDNAEPLANSRLMIATWPARAEIPTTMAVIEFATPADAKKFAPKLEKFLPKVLPPVPVEQPTPSPTASPEGGEAPGDVKAEEKTEGKAEAQPTASPTTKAAPPPAAEPSATPPREMRSPFVLTQSGALVFISERPVKSRATTSTRASAAGGEQQLSRRARPIFN